ncbi:MAG TPA: hypothetical protein PLS50_03225 [Candidatus Dojkabacteria bacterium]|nr:hypothetical protein [Candidatus Dojkabacteria bacterium]
MTKMKLRFGNGFSVSLWAEEVEEVQVLESSILYKTPSGKRIRIQMPVSWMKNIESADGNEDRRGDVIDTQEEGLQRRGSRESKIATEKQSRQQGLSSCKQMEMQISKLKSALEDFKGEADRNSEMMIKDLNNLSKDRENLSKGAKIIDQKMEDLSKEIEEIWETFDSVMDWRKMLEDYLHIEPMRVKSRTKRQKKERPKEVKPIV